MALRCAVLCCAQVVDEEASRFIASCVGDPEQRHTASQLLEDPFLLVSTAHCTCCWVYAMVYAGVCMPGCVIAANGKSRSMSACSVATTCQGQTKPTLTHCKSL